LLFFASPIYSLYFDLVVPDIAAVSFIVAAFYLFLMPIFYKSDQRYFLAGGALLGTAVSVKLNFVFLGTAILLVLLIYLYYHNRLNFFKINLLKTFILVVLSGSPWLIWNWLIVGHPIIPFGGDQSGWAVISSAGFQRIGLKELILLPWLVSTKSQLGFIFLAFLPFLFIRKKYSPIVKIIVTIAIFTIFIYIFSVQNWVSISIFHFNDLVRYNIGVWAIISTLVALAFFILWRLPNKILKYFLVLVLGIYFSYAVCIQIYAKTPKVVWLLGQGQPMHNDDNFMETVLVKFPALITPYYQFHPAVKFINELPDASIKVLTADARVYYFEKRVLVSHGFKSLPTWISLESPDIFLERVKANEVTHIIVPVYREWYTERIIDFFYKYPGLTNSGDLSEVYRWPGGAIYKVN